jgi:hypothetical protein
MALKCLYSHQLHSDGASSADRIGEDPRFPDVTFLLNVRTYNPHWKRFVPGSWQIWVSGAQTAFSYVCASCITG